jgi:hypothetical protein
MSKRMVTVMAIVVVLLPAFARQSLAQGPQEGIKVHGHWVIDVHNPDGTLVSHTEFENALKPGGAVALSMLLTRETESPSWSVTLEPDAAGRPFGVSGSVGLAAVLFEGVSDRTLASNYFGGLTVARVSGTVVLKGTATALANGGISSVSTDLGTVIASGVHGVLPFSGTTLPNSVALSAGQIVQVTVTLSFS